MVSQSGTDFQDSGAQGALDRYRDQLASIDAERQQLQAKDRRFGQVRLVLFLLFLLFLALGMLWEGDVPLATWIGSAPLQCFSLPSRRTSRFATSSMN